MSIDVETVKDVRVVQVTPKAQVVVHGLVEIAIDGLAREKIAGGSPLLSKIEYLVLRRSGSAGLAGPQRDGEVPGQNRQDRQTDEKCRCNRPQAGSARRPEGPASGAERGQLRRHPP